MTSRLKSSIDHWILTITNMLNEETTTVRNFLRNYRTFFNKKKTVIILNHGKPEGVFIPYKEWAKDNKSADESKTIPIRELIKGLTFKGGPTLSQDIDDILYGPDNQKT